VDCGACKHLCEAGAIYYETDLPEDEQQHLADNAAFFSETLPGRGGPIGSPGGACWARWVWIRRSSRPCRHGVNDVRPR
jgi:ferredoxin